MKNLDFYNFACIFVLVDLTESSILFKKSPIRVVTFSFLRSSNVLILLWVLKNNSISEILPSLIHIFTSTTYMQAGN